MKKLFVLLVGVVLFASGCTNDSYVMQIDKDNNISVAETISFDKTMMASNMGILSDFGMDEASLKQYTEKLKSDIMDSLTKTRAIETFDVKPLDNDKQFGFIQEKQNIPIENFKNDYLMLGMTSVEEKPITIKNGLFQDNYKIHLKYSFKKAYIEEQKKSQELDNQQVTSSEDTDVTFTDNGDGSYTVTSNANNGGYGQINSKITLPNQDIKFTIKTSSKVKKNNATNINNNEYQWDLFKLNDDVDIYLEYNSLSKTFGVKVTIATLLLVLILLFLVYKKSSEDTYL